MVDWEAVLTKSLQVGDGLDDLGCLSDEFLHEDLAIIQIDGSRACVNYELRFKGFYIDLYLRN